MHKTDEPYYTEKNYDIFIDIKSENKSELTYLLPTFTNY